MLIAGIAWASPTVRHGIDLIRSSKEIKAPLIETAVTRIAARPLAAKPPVETERQGTLRFLEFSETPDLKTSDGAGRAVGFSLRKDNPHPNPEIANSKTARSTSGAIASRLFQELRHLYFVGGMCVTTLSSYNLVQLSYKRVLLCLFSTSCRK